MAFEQLFACWLIFCFSLKLQTLFKLELFEIKVTNLLPEGDHRECLRKALDPRMKEFPVSPN